jgi:hypothetical protein
MRKKINTTAATPRHFKGFEPFSRISHMALFTLTYRALIHGFNGVL